MPAKAGMIDGIDGMLADFAVAALPAVDIAVAAATRPPIADLLEISDINYPLSRLAIS